MVIATHSSFFDHIKDILHLVDSTDVEVQKYTSLVLQNLASNELMWPPLIEHGITHSRALISIRHSLILIMDDACKMNRCTIIIIKHIGSTGCINRY
jgi:hypothetical protein